MRPFKRWLIDNTVWAILLMVVLVFMLTIDSFGTPLNLATIVSQSVFIGLLAIAFSIPLIAGEFDLSPPAVLGLTALLSAWLAGSSAYASGFALNSYLVLGLMVLLGLGVGAVNAFLVVRVGADSFLVTFATFIMLNGVAIMATRGQGVSGLPDSFRWIDTIRVFNLPLVVFLMLGLFGFFAFVLGRTQFGRHMYVVGGNSDAAFNFGVNVRSVVVRAFLISGSLAAVTGWILTARANGASPGVSTRFLFDVLAAVVIGGVSLEGGSGRIVGVLGGVLLMSVTNNALNLLAISPFVTQIIRGLILLAAVVLVALQSRLRLRAESTG